MTSFLPGSDFGDFGDSWSDHGGLVGSIFQRSYRAVLVCFFAAGKIPARARVEKAWPDNAALAADRPDSQHAALN